MFCLGYVHLVDVHSQLKAQNIYIEEQFHLAQQNKFSQSAEEFIGQGKLFNEAKENTVSLVILI